MTTDQLELVKVKKMARKRNASNESDHSDDSMKSLFGNKELINIDREDSDSLQKLALKFNCTVAEIKYANKIYNDQEFHALRTVKVPVVKGGQLYYDYTQAKDVAATETAKDSSEEVIELENTEDYINRLKHVQNIDFSNTSELCYISGEDSDYEINSTSDTKHLLADNTKFYNHKHSGHPVNVCDSTPPDFMNKMDENIKKGIEELESKSEQYSDADLDNVGFSLLRHSPSTEPSNSFFTCSFTWKHLVVIIFLLAIVIPILYFKHFVKDKEKE